MASEIAVLLLNTTINPVKKNPNPSEIINARSNAGLTQSQAAAMVYATLRTWQNWESPICSPAHRKMHPAIWELFLIKTGQNHVAKS